MDPLELTPEKIGDLSDKVEAFIMLELGKKVPYVGIIVADNDQFAIFTNRRSNKEVELILKEAIKAVRNNPQFSER